MSNSSPAAAAEPIKPSLHSDNALWGALLVAQKVIMNTCAVMVTITIVFSVIMRYFFHANLYGYEEIVTIFAFWMYFMGGVYGSYAGTHITADLVNVFIPSGRFKHFLIIAKDIITTGISALFTWFGWDFLSFGLKMHTKSPVWRLPMAISYTAVFLGFVLMTFYFAIWLARDIRAHAGMAD